MEDFGILSLLPALTALVLAFITREAIFSLLVGVLVGILVTGENLLFGFTAVVQESLGNADFIWLIAIQISVGVMIAFFQKSGSMQAVATALSKTNLQRRGAQGMSWLLGIFLFFSDYFSPLYTGTVMRSITDKVRVSREKLAYICDSTSAPVVSLVPFSSWGVYMAGLLVGLGAFTDIDEAMVAVIHMVPFNIYSLLTVAMVGLIAYNIIPDYGPMKKAEQRAMETGKVLADGAKPLIGKEFNEIVPKEGIKPNLFINFFAPALIIVVFIVGSYIVTGSAKTLEGFVLAVAFQFVTMFLQRMGSVRELIDAAVSGIKGVLIAGLILALAYCLNNVSAQLGTANYVISLTEGWMTGSLLLAFTFIVGAIIAFFTGTSYGTYAIITPIVIPLAFELTGGDINTLIYATVGAIMSAGVFGDHCSPLSDTSILSSLGAGSDHMDHVRTQLPYALSVGAVSVGLYFAIGTIL